MIKEYDYGGVAWVDLQNPSKKEIDSIMHRFAIPKDAAEDLLSPTPKQRVVSYDESIYIVLHFPTLSFHKNAFRGEGHRKEIDFIIGQNSLVTVHYDSMTAIEKFSKSIQKKEAAPDEMTSVHFFHLLIKNLYHYLLHDVETIKESLHKSEGAIFSGEEKKMVIELSEIHRDILRFTNALVPHREAIDSLRYALKGFAGNNSEAVIHDIRSEYERVERKMANNKALLDELRHTNDSLLSAKQNEAIKGLTMMAFMTFPLSLVAAVFAIHADGTPILGEPNAFWIILSMMAAILISCIAYFKRKEWL